MSASGLLGSRVEASLAGMSTVKAVIKLSRGFYFSLSQGSCLGF
jgi:hypothetical protein